MKKVVFLLFSFLFLNIFSYGQWTVQTVPDPIKDGGYVSNPDGIIFQHTVDSINRIIQRADLEGSSQVAVVLLNSIGEEDPKTFAHELLNYWGVGHEGKNNGLVILLVMDQRTVSFETGYGLEPILTDAECYQIQQEYMVPFFKEDDYDKGVLFGVIIAVEETRNNSTIEQGGSNLTEYNDIEELRWRNQDSENAGKEEQFLFAYLFIVGVLTLTFFILLFLSYRQSDRYKRYHLMRIFSLWVFPILFPVPFILLFIWTKKLLDYWRNTPRISPSGKRMYKLNEKDDDKHLTSGQITEEQIKSIDYDVWITDDGSEILILPYKRWFTPYSACPKCKYRTYYKVYDRVITPATTSSTGTGERKYACKHCNYKSVHTYVIPKLSESSSSGSSGGGGGSWGGSWGGGSSGGGGASSRW